MSKAKTYVALYAREGDDAWNVSIQGVTGCQTFGRSIRQAQTRIREALALWLDCEIEDLTVQDRLPADVAAVTARVTKARADAQRAGVLAQQQTADAVKTLTSLGVSRRDAGDLLGISHQRIQQLLQAS